MYPVPEYFTLKQLASSLPQKMWTFVENVPGTAVVENVPGTGVPKSLANDITIPEFLHKMSNGKDIDIVKFRRTLSPIDPVALNFTR